MRTEWPMVRLKHVARLAYGDSLATDNRESGDVPVFGSNGMVGHHSSANTRAPAIIVGRKGSFGKLSWTDVESFAIDTTYFIDSRLTRASLRWLYYCLHTLRLDDVSQDTGVPGLSRESAYSKRLPLPPLPVQRAIADFLDRKTAAIDELIRKKERLIELLQEKRQALITQAVTKGLDPNVPMKDSGIEWLGEIPAHWEVLQLRRVVAKFVDYRGRTPEKATSGVPLITAGAIRDGIIDHDRAPEFVVQEVYEELMKRGQPEHGDLLFTSEAPLGEVALVEDTMIACAQRIIMFKANTDCMDNRFLRLHFLSDSGRGEIASRASGSTAAGIRADRLKMSLVPTPPLDEQRAIINHVAKATDAMKPTFEAVSTQIDRLREYRQSLISAAVTGQLPIPADPTHAD